MLIVWMMGQIERARSSRATHDILLHGQSNLMSSDVYGYIRRYPWGEDTWGYPKMSRGRLVNFE